MDDADQFTVFEGSVPEDVSHARQLWSSMALLPPPESRLESADISQRLPVSRGQRGFTVARQFLAAAELQESTAALRQRRDERRKYEAMAEKKREIMAVVRGQREQRIQKDRLTEYYRPRVKREAEKKTTEDEGGCPRWAPDPETVRQLS